LWKPGGKKSSNQLDSSDLTCQISMFICSCLVGPAWSGGPWTCMYSLCTPGYGVHCTKEYAVILC
jgi:hypothetical protein